MRCRGGAVRSRLLPAGIALVVLGGCGNARTSVPQVGAPALPAGLRSLSVPGAGARLSVPPNWVLLRSRSPELLVLDTSGGAVIALWRYPRQGPAPRSARQLKLDRQRLLASARARDGSLRVISSDIGRISGAPAITLNTDERIGRRERRVQSTHVYGKGEELVLEEYAPSQYFATVDRTVFLPVLHSLLLTH